jgi:hypothetical protein
MAIDNSFLLQQMLNEQTKANDHLTAMREVLADSLKVQIQIAKGKGKNGSGGSGGKWESTSGTG